MSADTMKNLSTGVELTPYILSMDREVNANQVKNFDLNGVPHIQNIGMENYTITVEFIFERSKESLFMSAFRNADPVYVSNDSETHIGYITSIRLDGKQKTATHQKATITMMEEVAS